jgi:hypothetical protein
MAEVPAVFPQRSLVRQTCRAAVLTGALALVTGAAYAQTDFPNRPCPIRRAGSPTLLRASLPTSLPRFGTSRSSSKRSRARAAGRRLRCSSEPSGQYDGTVDRQYPDQSGCRQMGQSRHGHQPASRQRLFLSVEKPVPRGTPHPVIDKIVAGFNEAMRIPSVREALQKQALQPMEQTVASEIAKLYAADTETGCRIRGRGSRRP